MSKVENNPEVVRTDNDDEPDDWYGLLDPQIGWMRDLIPILLLGISESSALAAQVRTAVKAKQAIATRAS